MHPDDWESPQRLSFFFAKFLPNFDPILLDPFPKPFGQANFRSMAYGLPAGRRSVACRLPE
jgi:hypothetical protein